VLFLAQSAVLYPWETGIVCPVKKIIDAAAVIIRQLDKHLGGQGDGAGFVLGIGILRDMEQFGDLSLPDVAVLSDASQIFVNHNDNLRYHYVISVIQILTFICNTDII